MSNTANYGWPIPQVGQVDKLTPVQQALSEIDEDLKALDADVKNPGWNHVARFYNGSSPTVLKIKTNLMIGNRMVNLKLSGTFGNFTSPFEAFISFYYFDNKIYRPRAIWLASYATSTPNIAMGVEDGMFVVVITGVFGSHASMDVYARYGVSNIVSYSDISYMSVVAEDKEDNNDTFVSATISKVYHSTNTLIDPTTGCIAPA